MFYFALRGGTDMEDKDYLKFIDNIKSYIGVDLGLYKEAQMNRRMRTLYEKKGFNDYREYFDGLKSDKELLDEFLERMTINVTEFFRNGVRWEVLKKKVLPRLKEKSVKGKIKCWSAACSTGEEPFSLAMMLLEEFPSQKIEILATDIDDVVLKKAKEGIFTEAMLKGCPPNYIRKYFTKDEDDIYYIKDEVKKCITFRKHDLLNAPFGEGYDLIICRNVMIYFTEDAKEKLYHKFSGALSSEGVLFVGSTEQIFHPEVYGIKVYDAFFYEKMN